MKHQFKRFLDHPWSSLREPWSSLREPGSSLREPFFLASNEGDEGHDKETVLLVQRTRIYGPLLRAVVVGVVANKVATCWVYNWVDPDLVRAAKPRCSNAEASPSKGPLSAQGGIGRHPLTMHRRWWPSMKARRHAPHLALRSKAPPVVPIEPMWAKAVLHRPLVDTFVSSVVEPIEAISAIAERPPHPKRSKIGESFVLVLGAVPFLSGSVLAAFKQRLSLIIQFVLAQDPFLYLLLVVETNLAVGRNFLQQHDEYFRTILYQDPSHYYYWLEKGSRHPFYHIALLPGVLPWALQGKGKGKDGQVVRKRGTVASFLNDSIDLEFHIKWRPYQDMGIPLDTVINREDFCHCQASSAIKQELEFFASVQSTEHFLDSVSFVLRYYLFVKYLFLLVLVVLTPAR